MYVVKEWCILIYAWSHKLKTKTCLQQKVHQFKAGKKTFHSIVKCKKETSLATCTKLSTSSPDSSSSRTVCCTQGVRFAKLCMWVCASVHTACMSSVGLVRLSEWIKEFACLLVTCRLFMFFFLDHNWSYMYVQTNLLVQGLQLVWQACTWL